MFAVHRNPSKGKFLVHTQLPLKPKFKTFQAQPTTKPQPLSEKLKIPSQLPEKHSVLFNNKEKKKIKIRLGVIKDIPYREKMLLKKEKLKQIKQTKEIKQKRRRNPLKTVHNCGRWTTEEHERFVEAIIKYGNEWKQVQKHVKSRSSSQARSHAQKFFVKMKRANLFDYDIDLNKNSLESLHKLMKSLTADEYCATLKSLNLVAFEKKSKGKRNLKDIFKPAYDLTDYLKEDVSMSNTLSHTASHKNSQFKFSDKLSHSTSLNTNAPNEEEDARNDKFEKVKMIDNLCKKRHRNSSIDSFFNRFTHFEQDSNVAWLSNRKKTFDEHEYANGFNISFKSGSRREENNFEVEKLEDLFMDRRRTRLYSKDFQFGYEEIYLFTDELIRDRQKSEGI